MLPFVGGRVRILYEPGGKYLRNSGWKFLGFLFSEKFLEGQGSHSLLIRSYFILFGNVEGDEA